MAQHNLWGETSPRTYRRRRKNGATLTSTIPYSITGTGQDCTVIGHTLNHWSLAGTTMCLDCGANIFCPQCIAQHPSDPQAEPILCEQHEESAVNHAAI